MMRIRKFQARDRKFIDHWALLHGMKKGLGALPKIGVVFLADEERIAAGFLSRMDEPAAMLNGLITNPAASPQLRSLAIDQIVYHLVSKAKRLGLKAIFAFTKEESILKRSEKHGFKKLPDAFIALELE